MEFIQNRVKITSFSKGKPLLQCNDAIKHLANPSAGDGNLSHNVNVRMAKYFYDRGFGVSKKL